MLSTTSQKNSSFHFPDQSIHPRLVAALYAEVERLERRAAGDSPLPLPDDLGARMIATTLSRLDRDRVCLCPKKEGDLDTLTALALKTLRFQWHLTSRRDYGRAQKRVGLSAIEEIEATSGDRWHPRCDRFGGGSTLSGDRGRFPGDDLLAGETGRALVSVLENEFGLSRERALAVILLCYLPSFRVLVEALETLGCTDFSPSYLKKWTEKELPLLHLRLRDVLCDWGIASPNNAPSSL